jgi:hypothetical protein
MMRAPFRAAALLIVCLASLLSGASAARPSAAQPPPAYAALYAELEGKLDDLQQAVAAGWDGQRHDVAFSVELISANSNRGPLLLTEENFAFTLLLLDRLTALGARGVALSINYPLLVPTFPRADEYVDFYRRVAAAVRQRGLALIVETTTIFPDPEFSPIGIDYTGLTIDRYREEKRRMVETVIRELRPDYLTVESEPATVTRNTGLPNPVATHVATVRYLLDGLDRAGVQVGAGAGTWDNPAYFEALARDTDLDYLDLHIYPIQGDFVVPRVAQIAAMARQYGKRLSVGEAWLYKASARDLMNATPATAVTVFARNAFSFWAPLDQRFLGVLVTLCHREQMVFCAVFWLQYLFGYVEYTDETGTVPPQQLTARVNAVAARNIRDGVLSPTGETFRDLIR